MQAFTGLITLVIIIALAIGVYLLPTILAAAAFHHPQVGAIVALNLLLGWTMLGWVAALVWALTSQRPVVVSAPAAWSAVHQPPPSPVQEFLAGSPPTTDLNAELSKLHALREARALTAAEYTAAKAKLLAP